MNLEGMFLFESLKIITVSKKHQLRMHKYISLLNLSYMHM